MGTIKYPGTFNSDFQIDFSEIIEAADYISENLDKKKFRMSVEEGGVSIYLNGLNVFTEKKHYPTKPISNNT